MRLVGLGSAAWTRDVGRGARGGIAGRCLGRGVNKRRGTGGMVGSMWGAVGEFGAAGWVWGNESEGHASKRRRVRAGTEGAGELGA